MVEVSALCAEFERQIAELRTEHRVPGMAVGVCNAGGVIWSRGFGTIGSGGHRPVRTTTMFSVQSCSKMYTASAVLLAVQQGLLELDRPIVDYVPEFTVHSVFESHPERRITLRHLLSHTAGFTHEAPVGSNFLVGRESFTAHCRSIADTWLRFPVGHHYEYSNLGIDLAAYAVQRVSGISFEQFARSAWTARPSTSAREHDRARGHDRGIPRMPVRVPMIAAGGLYTSVDDACRFAAKHLSGDIAGLDTALLAEMSRVPFAAPGQTQGYGLGMVVTEIDGTTVHGHSGGGFGFRSDILWAPEEGIGVVVLTNSADHPLQWRIASDVLRRLVTKPEQRTPLVPPAFTLSQQQVHAVSGEYVGQSDTVTLTAAAGRPVLTRNGRDEPVRFTAPDEFVLLDTPRERFRFLDDTAGRPGYLQAMLDGSTRYRNDVPTPDPAEPDGPWNHAYHVRVSGTRIATARLRQENGVTLVDDRRGCALRLTRHGPGLYFSSTGEALNLTCDPITYANVRLVPADG